MTFDSGFLTVSLTAEPAGYVYGIPVYVSNLLSGTIYFSEGRPGSQQGFHASPGTHKVEDFFKLKKNADESRKPQPYDQETDVGLTAREQDRETSEYQRGYDAGYEDSCQASADDVKEAVLNHGLRFNAGNPQEASYYESRARDEVARLSKMNEKQYEIITALRNELRDWQQGQQLGQDPRRTADVEQIRELTNTVSAQQEEINYLRDQDKEWDLLIQDRDEALEEARQLKGTNAKLLTSNAGWMEAYNQLDKDFESRLYEMKELDKRISRQSDTIRQAQEFSKQLHRLVTGNLPDDSDDF